MMNKIKELMTVKELANLLNVSTHTIYYWISRNEIPYIQCGKHKRFCAKTVIDYFTNQTKEKNPSNPLDVDVFKEDYYGNSGSSLTFEDQGMGCGDPP